MHTCRYVSNRVIEVESFKSSEKGTDIVYWYFDTKKWLRSVLGLRDETPKQPMSNDEIMKVMTDYFPKAQKQSVIPCPKLHIA